MHWVHEMSIATVPGHRRQTSFSKAKEEIRQAKWCLSGRISIIKYASLKCEYWNESLSKFLRVLVRVEVTSEDWRIYCSCTTEWKVYRLHNQWNVKSEWTMWPHSACSPLLLHAQLSLNHFCDDRSPNFQLDPLHFLIQSPSHALCWRPGHFVIGG